MKIPFKKVALFLVLSLAAVSCEKETISDPVVITGEKSVRTVVYTIDGITGQMSFLDEESWTQFLEWLFALAEEGHTVNFHMTNYSQSSETREVVTYTTKKKEDAIAWADTMANNGYTVNVQYNPDTGYYTCTAIK